MELRNAQHVSNLAATALDGHIVLILRVIEPLQILIPLSISGKALAGVGAVDLVCSHKS